MRRLALVAVLFAATPALAQAPFDKSGIKDWTSAPKPTAEPTFKPPVVKRSKLKNGMSLLLVENHGLPIVSLRLVVPGAGAASDPAAKFGAAAFTADLIDEGAGGLSAIAISEEQDRLAYNDTLDTQRIPVGGTPGYDVYHLRLGWKPCRFATISAALENLTNEDYRVHGSGANEPGRNFVVAADFRF